MPLEPVGPALDCVPLLVEVLPNACLSATARDIFDVLTARQEPGGLVHIRQQELA